MFNSLIRKVMRTREVVRNRHKLEKPPSLEWRPVAAQPPIRRKDDWLVHCSNVATATFQLSYNVRGIPRKIFRKIRMLCAPHLREPQGQCEVPECNKGFDVALAERSEHIPIVLDFPRIEFSFLWLNTRPFDRNAMRVMAKRLRDIKIFFKAM